MGSQSFDDLLKEIHGYTEDPMEDSNGVIEINEKRQFIPSNDFNTVIAYEGDKNNQIITFACKQYQEGHNLDHCAFKELKWKNVSSGREGVSALKSHAGGTFELTWIVPPEACTQAGTLEISISFYDKKTINEVEHTVYSWNTGVYTGLSIGKSMTSVSFNTPPRDEILTIVKDTKNIIAPAGYNNVICNYGEVGTAVVYFVIDRYLNKYNMNTFDVMESEIAIYLVLNGQKRKMSTSDTTPCIFKHLYSPEVTENKSGLVCIQWNLPAEITDGDMGIGNLNIALEFSKKEGETITQRWFTNPYSQLSIGDSLIRIDLPSGNGSTAEQEIFSIIERYFEANEIIWEA